MGASTERCGAGKGHPGLITDPPHEVPFWRAFFEKAVALLAAEGQGNIRIPVPAQPSLEGEAEASAAAAEPAAAPAADSAEGGQAPPAQE
jgi:hypothetical protein